MNTRDIVEINTDEYRFLSEKFEFMSENDSKEIPRYILTTRKKTLQKILEAAVESELTAVQSEIVRERYFEKMKINDISEKHGFSRQHIHKILKAATDRLYSALKYAYLCGFSLVDLPKDFDSMLKNINGEN